MKLLICNTVYGQPYTDIFCKYHLRSMLDATNIPACKERVEYSVYTDEETLPWIQNHPNFIRLSETVPCRFFKFTWPENANRHNERYRALIGTFKMQIREALDNKSYLSSLVADLFVAKGWIPKMIEQLDKGHDAVFSIPMRSAFEPMAIALDGYPKEEVPTPFELFSLAYENMHPLWVASHWDSPQFTKLPYTLLWNSGSGLLARSFSISPIAFKPDDRMVSLSSVLDTELPSFFKNPFWAKNWLDAPIIGIEPLKAFYPPFANHKATTEYVKYWSARTLHHTQMKYLDNAFYFPCQESANINAKESLESQLIAEDILCLE